MKRIQFADGLRGLAALWVFLFHLSEGHHVDALKAQLSALFNLVVFDIGHIGVGIFFVLSGFVMALTVKEALSAADAGRFVLRRFIRLAPPYWIALTVAVMTAAAKGKALSVGSVLAHMIFMQGIAGYEPLNPVFWTLGIEIQFYAAFALMLWVSDTLDIRREVKIMAAMLALMWPILSVGPIWQGGFLPFWVFFMAGALIPSLTVIGTLFSICLLFAGVAKQDLLTVAAGSTAALICVANMTNRLQVWLSSDTWQALGLISYSFYLIHNPVTGFVFRLTNAVGHGPKLELAGAVLSLFFSMCVAASMYQLVERPAIRWSHLIGRKAPVPVPV